MPGSAKSSVYFAWPVTRRGSSRRLMAEPKMRDAMARPPSGLHAGGGFTHRRDDVLVAGAAAERPFQAVAHFRLARICVALQQVARGHDHARRAEAALQAVLVPESLLHDVQLAVAGETFDRGDRGAVRLHGEHRARLHRLPVEEDRADAALAGVAADVRAGEAELVAQEVDEEEARLDVRRLLRAVDREGDRVLHAGPPQGRVRLTVRLWMERCQMGRGRPARKPPGVLARRNGNDRGAGRAAACGRNARAPGRVTLPRSS